MTGLLRKSMVAGAAALIAMDGARAGETPIPGFTGIGDLPGGLVWSGISAVSADGAIVVGGSGAADGGELVRWTRAEGFAIIPRLPTRPDARHAATGVSADGSVIVGTAFFDDDEFFQSEAFRWTESTGTVGLGDLPGCGASPVSTAAGVSDDGLVIAGTASRLADDACIPVAYRWTQETGMMPLGALPGHLYSWGFAISRDGRTIVGKSSLSVKEGVEAFRWTPEKGMIGLGDLPGGPFFDEAHAVSVDGSVVAGWGNIGQSPEPFRWTQETGMTNLGALPGGEVYGFAQVVSADGSMVFGSADTPEPGGGAFIWRSEAGMQQLFVVLTEEYGIDLGGWSLENVAGISIDGRTIVGNGFNPEGHAEGWVAFLGGACRADWDGDGGVDSDDFFAFLTSLFAGKADFDADGDTDSDDFFAFLGAYFNGCPE